MTTTNYNFVATILGIITIILTLAGLVFACVQLWQIKTNRKRQFDQLRREKTVEMVIYYNQSINDKINQIEKIVSCFSEEQCSELYGCTPFAIDKNIKNKLCTICPYQSACKNIPTKELKKCELSTGEYYIKDDILYFLRGQVINYLNSLETVLLSWQLGIVDQKTIEEQFVFLNKKNQQERTLEIFRSVAGGGNSYPAIEKYYQYLDQKEKDEAKETLKSILQ